MSIGQQHFVTASTRLRDAWQNLQSASRDWSDVQLIIKHGDTFLRMTRTLREPSSALEKPEHENDAYDGTNECGEEEIQDQDDEMLASEKSGGPRPNVTYDIVHSPSYQVPVLYISANDHTSQPPALSEIYRRLVSHNSRTTLQAEGVLGALSMTDHPVTGLPAYFVHPCRTAEAMETSTGRRQVSPAEYLLIWIGLIGQGVGLNVPSELAQVMMRAQMEDR